MRIFFVFILMFSIISNQTYGALKKVLFEAIVTTG